MALQVKVHYGGERFATFLLRNVTYETLLQTIQRNCSPLAHLGQDSIRFRYKDEDRDFVNISPDDPFALSEMLRMVKQVGDRGYKKIYIKAHVANSPVLQKMRRLDSGGLSTAAAFSGGKLEPKQLTYRALAPVAYNSTNYNFVFYSSQGKESIGSEGGGTKVKSHCLASAAINCNRRIEQFETS